MKQYPDRCAQCGREIPEGEPASGKYKPRREGHWQVHFVGLACNDCEPIQSEVPDPESYWPYNYSPDITPCPGCGRMLAGRARTCSERCAQKARRGGPLKDRTCEHCGESFTPTRSDARFCSTKCRVYANRANK